MPQAADGSSQPDFLDEIHQLFTDGSEDDAIELLDAYLDEYPSDLAAELLKIELCLEANSHAADIGQALTRLVAAYPDSEQVQHIQAVVDEQVRAQLDKGRRDLRSRYARDAAGCFETALALAPTDPAVALAAALALINDDDDSSDDEDVSPLDILNSILDGTSRANSRYDTKIDAYLQRCVEIGPPNHPAVIEAHEQIIRRRLAVGEIGAALDLLASHTGERLQPLLAELPHRTLLVVLGRAAVLLRAGMNEQADQLLTACLEAAPDMALAYLLHAEALVLAGDDDTAFGVYEQILILGNGSPVAPPLDRAQTIWELAQAVRLTCPHCGKSSAADTATCDFCGQSLKVHTLLIDRYTLNGTSEAIVARIGLAELLARQGNPAAAITQIDAALAALPGSYLNARSLSALRNQWMAEIQPIAESQPPAQAVFAAWPLDGLTPDILAQIRHLCDTTPLVWHDVPPEDRRALARALLQEHQLALTQVFLRAAFDHETPADLQVDLDASITAQVAQLVEQARRALADHLPERALAQIEQALQLRADDPTANLLRAEALVAQGNPLAGLAACRSVLAHASDEGVRQAAQLGIAHALEVRNELDAALRALDSLEGPSVQNIRDRILRRQHGEPVISVRSTTSVVMHDTLERVEADSYFNGFFAVTVGAVRRPWESGGWSEHILAAGLEFTQTLGGLRHQEGDPIFALRLIAYPDARIPERGRLMAALLVRVSAPDADACRTLALDLWGTIRTILPLTQDFVYSFEPVVDETALDTLLEPFEPVTLAEIVRREDVPQQDSDRYAVYPFTPGSLDLHNLCWTLLRQPAPSMLSIHLLPTDLMPWETVALDRVMLGEPSLASEEMSQLSVNNPVWYWWQGAQLWNQIQTNRHLVDTLRVQAYVMNVTVAGSTGASPLLPDVVATTLFGPVRRDGDAMLGGYDIVRAVQSGEVTAACRNLSQLDVERWTYTAAPNGAARLRHLVGESQAALAFRFPIPGASGIPGIPCMDVKPIAPPANLPENGTVLGESVIRLSGLSLRITQGLDDRRRHTYIVGKTGTGKSTLIKYMALQDIEAGHGVCVIDPHGDLVEDILAHIPAHRLNDVILFDPADEERPIGLNLLQASSETEKHRIVTEFIGLLVRMYDPGQTGIVGPRFQHNVRNAMLTVMAVEGSTMIEVVRALTDIAYVRRILPHVTDPLVRNYWEKQIANTSDFHKSEILDYIVSKFSRFVGDQMVRNIVGQRETTIDFRQVMDRRQVLLVNLSKGKIGPESAQFLGLLLVQRLLLTALSRADLPPDQRPDFFLYVDEFQNFATELFATVLSEGRKYGVAVTVANQYLTQLDREIREAIFGNVGTLISFRLGTQDAIALSPELYPVFDADDLLNLPKFTTCVKLLVDGLASRPFTMQTVLDSRAPNPERKQLLRSLSRQRYGRDAMQVSEDVLARFAPDR